MFVIVLISMCVCVCMCNQQVSEEWGRNAESVSLRCFSGLRFEEQCRESLSSIHDTRQESRPVRKKRERTGSEKKMRPPPLRAKEEAQ